MPACCSPTRRPATTRPAPAACGDLLDHWSVQRLKEAGADCVKILLYYTPFDPKDINDKKHAWVERIGDECRANDIPFFLELVGYEEGADEKGLEYAKKKPEIVKAIDGRVHQGPLWRGRAQGRSADEHEVRRRARNLQGPEGVHQEGGRCELFLDAATAATKPFIYLSAGVSNAEFNESLDLAAETGVKFNGVLCGRATWKDGIPIFAEKGVDAFRDWLKTEGVKNIENVNERLKKATPWYSIYETPARIAA